MGRRNGISSKIESLKRSSYVTYTWLRQSSERFGVAVVLAITAALCFLLLVVPKTQIAGSGHGGHGDHGEEEHEEGADENASVELEDDVLESSGIDIEEAAATKISPAVTSRGQIVENPNRSMNVKPRFGGIVKSVHKDFGDHVRKGEPLAVIETASTRSTYTIRTVLDGIVADKRVVVGAFVLENESIFRILDLGTVWFQGKVPLREAHALKAGFQSHVRDRMQGVDGTGTVVYVSPVVEEDTQAIDVRIELENKAGLWRVGSFGEASIQLKPIDAVVAIKNTALQEFNGQTVVFIRQEDRLVATPVVIGRTDEIWSEVLAGVEPGDRYVSRNSFLAKAELLKSTAEHEH